MWYDKTPSSPAGIDRLDVLDDSALPVQVGLGEEECFVGRVLSAYEDMYMDISAEDIKKGNDESERVRAAVSKLGYKELGKPSLYCVAVRC